MSLSIGLLLDSSTVPTWQRDLIQDLSTSPEFQIKIIAFPSGPTKDKHKRKPIYKLLRRFDRWLYQVSNDAFVRRDIGTLIREVRQVDIACIRKTFGVELEPNGVRILRDANLDVIIRLGFGIIRGDVLHAARYGVWSLHHGDNSINRGGPPAFWEVVNKEAVTGVTLQRLTEQLDGGVVISQAFIKTDGASFNRNQNQAFRAGNELLISSLLALTKNPDTVQVESDLFYHHPLYRDPENSAALTISFNYLLNHVRNVVNKILFRQQWILLIKKGKNTALFQFRRIASNVKSDWADPFLIKHNGSSVIFFEDKPLGGKGHISCFTLDDKGKLESQVPVPVLKEDYHLSYPFVFKEADKVFMIPEAAESGVVWLYESVEFPLQWRRKRMLLSEPLYDATLFFKDGYWYLFGTKKPYAEASANQYAYIYYCKDFLVDKFDIHPCSPMMRDVRGARPAGRIFEKNGKLIRPGQVGAPKYGYSISFFEIIKLSPTEYAEVLYDEIKPNWSDDLLATHTFNNDGGITVIDAQIRIPRFNFY